MSQSFEFAVNIFLLKTTNTDIVHCCQDQLGFKLPNKLITHRTEEFIAKLHVSTFKLRI